MKITQLLNESQDVWKYAARNILNTINDVDQKDINDIQKFMGEGGNEPGFCLRTNPTDWERQFVEFLIEHFHLNINWDKSGFLNKGYLFHEGSHRILAEDIFWKVYESSVLTVVILNYCHDSAEEYDEYIECCLTTDNAKLSKAFFTTPILNRSRHNFLDSVTKKDLFAKSTEQIIRLGVTA
jgi:hypothetical protein